MNSLDELLSSTARVADITPAALHNGRAALESAIADLAQAESAPQSLHRPAQRPHKSKRGMFIATSVAAAAAVAAAATASVLSSHSSPSGNSNEPKAAGGAASSNAGNAGNAGINLTAATVLRNAGKAAGEQQGGWPNAAYWYVTSVYERDSKTYHRDIWIAHHGNGVLEDDGVFGSMTPDNLGTNFFTVGGTDLTWEQLYALPTDPAKLEPVLQSDIKGAGPNPTAELYSVVGDLLRESPAPPALREALYEVAAGIPGVKLVGHYKDALGRTGTAVERDGETLVIDPSNGQLLADIMGNPRTGISCGNGCVEYGVDYAYVSEGPATSAPAIPG
jgi:hypothetical protein